MVMVMERKSIKNLGGKEFLVNMKTTHNSIFVFIVMSCFSIFKGVSQNTNLNYLVELKTSISTNTTLPFWMVSNNFGAFPNKDNTSNKCIFIF